MAQRPPGVSAGFVRRPEAVEDGEVQRRSGSRGSGDKFISLSAYRAASCRRASACADRLTKSQEQNIIGTFAARPASAPDKTR